VELAGIEPASYYTYLLSRSQLSQVFTSYYRRPINLPAKPLTTSVQSCQLAVSLITNFPLAKVMVSNLFYDRVLDNPVTYAAYA